ncbi:MAG: alginate export family protein [Acidobacteria bacterium]|nr:alginate export family protein [Acidobacteriota bacterium]
MALCQASQQVSIDPPRRPPRGNGSASLKRVVLAGLIWILSAPVAFGQGGAPKRDETPVTLQSGLGDELPSWLSLSGEFRFRFENGQGLGYSEGSDDGYGLTRTRLEVGVRPVSWLNFGIQAQDSRAPGIRPALANSGAVRDPIDLRQAYAEIGASRSPASLKVGRQALIYGDSRLIGAPNWSNTSRVFDAVRLQVRGSGAKLDLFSASVVRNDPNRRLNRSVEGEYLHGLYGSLENVIPGSTLEPYLLWQTKSSVVNELNAHGDLDRYTLGFRAWGKGLGPWDYNAALVRQWGQVAGSDIQAWAYYAELGYSIEARLNPRLYIHYNFGSGDKDSQDGRFGGFVNLYPTTAFLYGRANRVGWRNHKGLRLGSELKPYSKLTLLLEFHSFWLASKNDALYSPGGRVSVAPPSGGARDAKVGNEVDAVFTVPVTSNFSLGGGLAHMLPGPFVKANTPGHPFTYSYLFSSYRF